ncbi:uncharacterized protein LOC144356754 [Saccoglossus kowalevskii]
MDDRQNWDQSKQTCNLNGYGSQLVSITHFDELQFLRTRILEDYNGNDYWVGATLSDNGWEWLSGQPWLNSMWAADGEDEGAPCARLRETDEYFLNDRVCSVKAGYICKRVAESIALDEQQLVCAGNEDNYDTFCYKVIDDQLHVKDFEGARQECLADGYYLSSISTSEEHDFLKTLLSSKYSSRQFWVGAKYQSNAWVWLGGDDWNDVVWAANGETDGADCALINRDDGYALTGTSCNEKHGYVCKRVADTLPIVEAGNCDVMMQKDTCYIVSNHRATWDDARDYCAAMGGNLAKLEKKNVRSKLDEIASEKNFDIWIGLHDLEVDGSPYWTCGDQLKSTNSEKKLPWAFDNDNTGDNDCVRLVPTSEGEYEWQYANCDTKYHYMCVIEGVDDKTARASLDEKQNRLKADRHVHMQEPNALLEEVNSGVENELLVEIDIMLLPEEMERLLSGLSPVSPRGRGKKRGQFVDNNGNQKSRRRRNALAWDTYYWPDGVVYYDFSTSAPLASEDEDQVMSAIAYIENRTCIRFTRRTDQQNYINIFSGDGCWSYLGHTGSKQDLSLDVRCVQLGVILHEMFHALGFWHEHSRYDRDDFVSVNWDNIKPDMISNFDKYDLDWMNIQGLEYDYSSILHYNQYAFAVDRSIPTMTPTNPPTAYIGQRDGFSPQDLLEINSLYNCPIAVDGGYSPWSEWSACSVSCDGGIRSRSRVCNNPAPSVDPDGAPCDGPSSENSACMIVPCPSDVIDYTWAGCWWDQGVPSLLTTLEGTGNPYLTEPFDLREDKATKCALAAQQVGDDMFALRFGGKCYSFNSELDGMLYATEGPSVECVNGYGSTDSIDVYVAGTPNVDGGWSVWSSYGSCSLSCGGGTKQRSRVCNNPSRVGDGADCAGSSVENIDCNTQGCPVDGGWSDWGEWNSCYPECGYGWSLRFRDCNNPLPENGGLECIGDDYQYTQCFTACPIVDGGWSEWYPGACSASCGNGTIAYTRECNNPAPQNGGADCYGEAQKEEVCVSGVPCPVDGGYSDWGEWEECSLSCGVGHQTRSRLCDNPEPEYGGQNCQHLGSYLQTQSCNEQHCPVDGGWGNWGEWGECTLDCADGVQVRLRLCDNPKPMYGGADCIGEDSMEQLCDLLPSCNYGPDIIEVPVLDPILETADIFYPMDNMQNKKIFGIPHNIDTKTNAALVDFARYGRSLSLQEGDWVQGGNYANSCLSSPMMCNGGFTVSFWLKVGVENQPLGNNFVFDTGSSQGFSVYIRKNKLLKAIVRYGEREYSVDMPSNVLNVPIWHHIAITASPLNGLMMYYKGQPFNWDYFGRTSPRGSDDVLTNFTIGKANGDQAARFVGEIDEVAIWYQPLKADEIYQIFRAVPPDCQDCDHRATCEDGVGCVCAIGYIGDGYMCYKDYDFAQDLQLSPVPVPLYFWPMDIIQDQSIVGSSPVITKGQMLVSNGVEDGAVSFNGRRDWVKVGNFRGQCLSYPDACSNGFTISFWMKFYGRGVDRFKNFILSTGAQADDHTGLYMYALQGNHFIGVQTTAMMYQITYPYNTLYWSHYVIGWSTENGLNLYIDGEIVASSLGEPKHVSLNRKSVFAVGKPNHFNTWNGRFVMDNLAVWDQELEADQVDAVMMGGVGDVSSYQRRHARSPEKFRSLNKKRLSLMRKK